MGSPHFNGTIFLNPVPTEVMQKGSFFRVLRKSLQRHPHRHPTTTPGPFPVDRDQLSKLPSNALRVTWLGHSTVLLEVEGKRLLTDPLWYQRASPFTLLGPRRFFDNPLSLDQLPPIDAILLSHDHYDHLDKGTMTTLMNRGIPVVTMLGVGDRLRRWGGHKTLITELDWWDSVTLEGGLTITAAPARHFSGRWVNDRFHTLWGSFAIRSSGYRVYYGADSGYYPGFAEIGERLGPFDLTLLEIGAYNKEWESIHMGPEAAVQAHLDLRGRLLMPIHWGTFSLAFHPWKEPIERLIKQADLWQVPLLVPTPGETVRVTGAAYNSYWWDAYR